MLFRSQPVESAGVPELYPSRLVQSIVVFPRIIVPIPSIIAIPIKAPTIPMIEEFSTIKPQYDLGVI